MTTEEYMKWSLRQSIAQYYRQRNQELFLTKGNSKFDFTDMRFSLGPAEKIFGPGGVHIKTQGSAELKIGGNMKSTDNPTLAASRRSSFGLDFDMKINMTVNAKVGDKVNMNLNYNSDATFDYDAQNLKLKYEGKEDEIIKLVEAGNISMPSNMSLVPGVSSLFGLRTDVQFGKLKLQTVFGQKKSASKSVSGSGGSNTTTYEITVTDYEENRHFYLAHHFRDTYDKNMRTLPTIASGVTIKRIEVWVTNKTGTTTNTRNIIALTDLGEPQNIRGPWQGTGGTVPHNRANNEYSTLIGNPGVRDISQVGNILDGEFGLQGSFDYDKLQSARLLSSSEYHLNAELGTLTLNTTLQPDDILAVAYE
jgi:cell surface protein SprA